MPGHFNGTDAEDGAFASTKATNHVGVFGTNEATSPPTGGGAGGAGVFGLSISPGAAGVFGANNSGKGVGVQGNGPEVGVNGFSQQGAGVQGISQSSASFGVFGNNDSQSAPTGGGAGGAGVFGLSISPGAAGVFGANNSGKGVGVQGNGPERGVSGFSDTGAGAVGQSNTGSGVLATSQNGQGLTVFSDNDIGIFAQGATFSGVFNGALVVNKGPDPKDPSKKPSDINGSLVINDGNLFLNTGDILMNKGDIRLSGADCAEEFNVSALGTIVPGTVMVINAEGGLQPSDQPYDKKVAGVISGAGDYRPGLVLDNRPSDDRRMPIALMGKVYCKVDAQYAAIDVGDLLTTSPTPGHAMKAGDRDKAFGSVLGKALRAAGEGQVLIPVLVSLQ